MYTQHQAHINELQRAIDKLKAQLREKENCITEKITIIREKERIDHPRIQNSHHWKRRENQRNPEGEGGAEAVQSADVGGTAEADREAG